MTTILKIGDVAWWANCGTKEVETPCPVCFGKRSVTVILGNDEHVQTPCEFCGKGYYGPRGVIDEWEWRAEPRQVTIKGVQTEQTASGMTAQYTFLENYIADDKDLFATEAEALARCAERIAEHKAEETRRREHMKEYDHRNYSWHVGYHRKEAKEAARRLEWHNARAIACKALAQTPVPA